MSKPRQRLTHRAYKVFRLLVRLISIAIFLLVCAFVFLRIHGVPGPLLREAVRRANAAGVPVDVENITLTLRGWRADHVRYYSKHPDDLDPLFHAEQVLFVRKHGSGSEVSNAWNFDVEAEGITMNPSVEWGIEVPPESGFRDVDELHLSLGFHPDRIVLADGTMSWLGARFNVNGTVLRRKKEPVEVPDAEPGKARSQETILPVFIDAQQFQALETRLKTITLNDTVEIEIDFLVDTGNYAASRIAFGARATDIAFREVGFSGAELSGNYAYPVVELERAVLFKDNQSLELSGRYDLDSGLVEGKALNSIVSKRLLLLLPQPILDLLVKAQLRFDYLPRLSVAFGPARPKDLLNAVTGSFSIGGVNYRDLEIDTLEGKLSRKNNRLELGDLSGTVLGQEERAEETGSCMLGGAATGAVFWDLNTHEFGVEASGSFDPTLLIEPLSMIDIATNIIARFRFKDRPPQASLRLGSCYLDGSTFYIDIQGMANGVSYEDVEFSSMNVSAFYKLGVLRLDPIAAMQGVDFMKGSASIDLLNSTATFDAFGSLHPAALEDAIYPGFNLFGNKILTEGDTQIKARGTLDWATMQATDFSAEVEAAGLDIPVARMDGFRAIVTGEGPLISVKEATFGLYQGSGQGEFSILLDPETNSMPYEMDVRVEDGDFRKCLEFLRPDVGYRLSGTLSGNVHFEADMARDFFETANGEGSLVVKNGQLADLPFFSGFSRLMRKVIPGFNVFSITSLSGTYTLEEGVVRSEDAYFAGDVISAKAKGSYSKKAGFDALVQAQVLNDKGISKLVRAITDPIFRFFELKLEGSLSEPSWRLEKLPSGTRNPGPAKEGAETD